MTQVKIGKEWRGIGGRIKRERNGRREERKKRVQGKEKEKIGGLRLWMNGRSEGEEGRKEGR